MRDDLIKTMAKEIKDNFDSNLDASDEIAVFGDLLEEEGYAYEAEKVRSGNEVKILNVAKSFLGLPPQIEDQQLKDWLNEGVIERLSHVRPDYEWLASNTEDGDGYDDFAYLAEIKLGEAWQEMKDIVRSLKNKHETEAADYMNKIAAELNDLIRSRTFELDEETVVEHVKTIINKLTAML